MHILSERRRLWIVPTVLGVAIGILGALTTSRKWEASQTLIVRQEAAGAQHQRPGSFSTIEEMKKLQETILEIAKSRSVLAKTLAEVGPSRSGLRREAWPREEEIDELRKNIRMTSPGGAEFGLTEVAYLSVRATDRERALELLAALCDQLEARFMEVRSERAESMIGELQKTIALAEQELEEATARLAEFETGVGADLTELRMLESPSGTSDLRQKLVALENSRQEYVSQTQQQQKLLEMLLMARDDPEALVATPNSLLDAQPALRRLKEGVVEAQLVTSRLLGRLSPNHPQVVAAQQAEQEVRESLRRELATAIRGVEVDLQVSTERTAAVKQEIASGRAQLDRLATLRAHYANLVALAKDRLQLVEQARRNLADAQASQASARAASLIGRIDAPYVGIKPVGPGRAVIAAAGLAGGLAVGLALVFLFGMPDPASTLLPIEVASGPTAAEPAGHDMVAIPLRRSVHRRTVALADPARARHFGMFRGMTLRQALEEVRQRGEMVHTANAES